MQKPSTRQQSKPVNVEPAEPSLVTVNQVHAEFEKLLRNRNHMGVRNFLGDTFLESRNPFQKTRRGPNKWVVAIAGILFLALLIVYNFHVS
jgi:hypothetical protein